VLNELFLSWCREVDIDVTDKRYISSQEVSQFLDDVGTYSHYLFSEAEQDAMDDAYEDKPIRTLRLIQGGKKDDAKDELIN
jgi:hypothetical protein